MSCHVISYHIISYHIISYHIISYHIISYHIISYHIISYHIISYHIISYHIISYHIISYHIISYHIISYKIALNSNIFIYSSLFYYNRVCASIHSETLSFSAKQTESSSISPSTSSSFPTYPPSNLWTTAYVTFLPPLPLVFYILL